MTLSTHQWHLRYRQQALWTGNLRKYVFDRIGIQRATRILDVGCGTGVLLNEVRRNSSSSMFGLDINQDSISFAQGSVPSAYLTIGNALSLPFKDGSFDITLCHFLLLWINNPLFAIQEMVRVTHPGGFVLALAEPDYGGRIDYPEELIQIGRWQTEALLEQGANPFIGRELRSLFSIAGLTDVEAGVLGGQWRETQTKEDIDLEWMVIKSDLHRKKEFITQANELKALDQSSREKHQRILYVPTFYAVGVKKD
ncbi:MAG: hypothetical protein A2Y53_02290 [Chloroflexi bacterium RBG_16_47_49]|nr:MAG: hypothetical protein A2Y53_02290 [Chloroflexi bacterium RBG_16_47_49]